MDNKEYSFFSPAKINLFFRVLRKRDDGYHQIESLIQTLDFGDTLFFSLSPNQDVFSSTATYLSWNPDNLIYRAVNLFRRCTQRSFHVKIHLDKHIPCQAGLGGGSSNAATTLYALNQLLGTKLSDAQLAVMGKELGSDVPCFFGYGRVFAEGIGDEISDIDPHDATYTLIKPLDIHLPTPEVYAHLDLANCSSISSDELLKSFSQGQPQLINDLESAAFKLQPRLKEFKLELEKQSLGKVVMTGSGSAFVCTEHLKREAFCEQVGSIYRPKHSWYSK